MTAAPPRLRLMTAALALLASTVLAACGGGDVPVRGAQEPAPSSPAILGRWSGKVAHSALRELAPGTGYVCDAAAWQALWQAWRPAERVPAVDFGRALVLVATVDGPNTVAVVPHLSPRGDASLAVTSTKMAGPGFGYALLAVARDGVRAVNGIRLAGCGA